MRKIIFIIILLVFFINSSEVFGAYTRKETNYTGWNSSNNTCYGPENPITTIVKSLDSCGPQNCTKTNLKKIECTELTDCKESNQGCMAYDCPSGTERICYKGGICSLGCQCYDNSGCNPTQPPPPPPNPTATNAPPQGTLSCPSQIVLPNSGIFTLNGSDSDSNLASAGLYYSLTSSQHWYRINDNNDCNTQDCSGNITCTGASCTPTQTWTPNAIGTYYVAANYYDSAGGKCTGNPWTPYPSGWVACGNPNSYCTVSVVTPTATPIPPTNPPPPPNPTATPIPPTATPIPPTATPIPPTSTPIPPTTNPACVCGTGDLCDATNCTFDKFAAPITYANPIKCSLSSSLFATAPSTANKTSWCQAGKRTKGDADGNGIINNMDYFYYISAFVGGKIPATVNPDFNGDGEVSVSDRTIVVKSLE